MAPEMTSFNNCPPKVIKEIFSHLLDAGSKIRLERVSKLFRDCVRNEDSWRRNTTLEMKEFGSDVALRSFLSHAKEINTLSLRECDAVVSPQMMATLCEFEDKLKIKHFHISKSTPEPEEEGEKEEEKQEEKEKEKQEVEKKKKKKPQEKKEERSPCPDNSHLVAVCFGKFHKSLESMDLGCCGVKECNLVKIFTLLLPRCTNLRHLTLQHFYDYNFDILPALTNLNLETLNLVDFYYYYEDDPEALPAVFNSARGHTIRSLKIEDSQGSTCFDISEFLEQLEAPAAQAITSIQLLNVLETDWRSILATLPTQLPNLERMTISEEDCGGRARDKAWRVASAIGGFLHDCLERPNGVHVKLIFFKSSAEFDEWLWKYVGLMEIKQSGTQPREEEEGWKRIITNHRGTVELEIRRQ